MSTDAVGTCGSSLAFHLRYGSRGARSSKKWSIAGESRFTFSKTCLQRDDTGRKGIKTLAFPVYCSDDINYHHRMRNYPTKTDKKPTKDGKSLDRRSFMLSSVVFFSLFTSNTAVAFLDDTDEVSGDDVVYNAPQEPPRTVSGGENSSGRLSLNPSDKPAVETPMQSDRKSALQETEGEGEEGEQEREASQASVKAFAEQPSSQGWSMDSEGLMLLAAAVFASYAFDLFQKERAKFQVEVARLEEQSSTLQKQLKVETEAIGKALTELRKLEVAKGYSDEKVLRMQVELQGQQSELNSWQKEVTTLRVQTQEKAFEMERITFELEATRAELGQKEADLGEVGRLLAIWERGEEETRQGEPQERVLERVQGLLGGLSEAKLAVDKATEVSLQLQERLRGELLAVVQDADWLREELEVVRRKYKLLVDELALAQERNSMLEQRLKGSEKKEGVRVSREIPAFEFDAFDSGFSEDESSGYDSKPGPIRVLPSKPSFKFVTNPMEAALSALSDSEEEAGVQDRAEEGGEAVEGDEVVSSETERAYAGFLGQFGDEMGLSEDEMEDLAREMREELQILHELQQSAEKAEKQVVQTGGGTEGEHGQTKEDSGREPSQSTGLEGEELLPKESEDEEGGSAQILPSSVASGYHLEEGLSAVALSEGEEGLSQEEGKQQREVNSRTAERAVELRESEGVEREEERESPIVKSGEESDGEKGLTSRKTAVLSGGKAVIWNSDFVPPLKRNKCVEMLDKEVESVQKSLAELNSKLGSGST